MYDHKLVLFNFGLFLNSLLIVKVDLTIFV